MYTIPLGAVLRHHKIGYHIYADDTQLYVSFDYNNQQHSLNQLTTAISDVRSWMISNKLKINDDKTEFLVLTSKSHSSACKHSINIGTSTIQPSRSAKNLGVTLDSTLSMEKHIASVSQSCLYQSRNISAIRKQLTNDDTAKLIHLSRLVWTIATHFFMASLIKRSNQYK